MLPTASPIHMHAPSPTRVHARAWHSCSARDRCSACFDTRMSDGSNLNLYHVHCLHLHITEGISNIAARYIGGKKSELTQMIWAILVSSAPLREDPNIIV